MQADVERMRLNTAGNVAIADGVHMQTGATTGTKFGTTTTQKIGFSLMPRPSSKRSQQRRPMRRRRKRLPTPCARH